MQYNVAQLLKESMGSTRGFRVAEGPVEGLPGVASVSGSARMVRTHRGVLVNASLEVETALTCSRCVYDFDRRSTLHIEEEFFPAIDLWTGRRTVVSPEDAEDGLLIDDEHVLDLTEVTRQYVIAEQPMKPLCCPDCLGLCPECGADLNRSACVCREEAMDPRWQALAGLLESKQT